MKIVFICGCLEPGHDGVGDYTRRLSGELIRTGIEITIISLYDKFITVEFTGIQKADETSVPVLRLPALFPLEKRLQRVKELIKKTNPEHISLQYVPYSFNKFGVPILLGLKLSSIKTISKWHIMIHEPFLGGTTLNIKSSIIRYLQIYSLKFLVYFLKPSTIHTSILYYKNLIFNTTKINSKVLNLFGNIKIASNSLKYFQKNDTILAVYFGTAPLPSEHFMISNKLGSYLKNLNKPFLLVVCGIPGAHGAQFEASLKKVFKKPIHTLQSVGILQAEELSALFSKAEFGIVRVPPRLLGKSGTAVTMLEHGLPLWLPKAQPGEVEEYVSFRPNLCLDDIGSLEKYIGKTHVIYDILPKVASDFISDVCQSTN